jgi:hypothetical protein
MYERSAPIHHSHLEICLRFMFDIGATWLFWPVGMHHLVDQDNVRIRFALAIVFYLLAIYVQIQRSVNDIIWAC